MFRLKLLLPVLAALGGCFAGFSPALAATASFQPAFQVFPGTLYENQYTHGYARAGGTVAIPGPSGQACLASLTGLTPGQSYSVFFTAAPIIPHDPDSAGPFVKMGDFTAAADGSGSYVCGQAPPASTNAFINDNRLGITVLISGQIGGQPAAAPCQYILGFATLHSLDPTDVGDCLDNQQFAANGDALQHTTRGLLVWRKADNFTAFTDGYWTWINGPTGLAKRLNSQRFPWETASSPA